MKRSLTMAVLALLVSYVPAHGGFARPAINITQASASIESIRQHYSAINKNLARYRKVKKELTGFSAEGGEMVAYFDGASIMKIVANYYGESGRALEEFYYWNGKLIFVFRKDYGYDTPMSGKVVRTSENRFYFSNDQLIKWIDEKGKQVAPGGAQYKEKQEEYLQSSSKFTNAARSDKRTIEAFNKSEPYPARPVAVN